MVVNKEIDLYLQVAPKIKLQKVWELLEMTPHSGQQGLVEAMDNAPTKNSFVLTLGRRAQALDTLIHTPEGVIKLRDLKEGCCINDTDGGTQTITEMHPIIKEKAFRVTLASGGYIDVNEEHLFTITDHHNRERVLPVKHLIKYYEAPRKNSHKPGEMTTEFKFKVMNPAPLYKTKKEFTIDPYALGLLLGDGSITGRGASLGMQDLAALEDYTRATNCPNLIRETRPGYYLVSVGADACNKLEALNLLGTYSDTKFIPEEYLRGSVEQRLDLLRGLIDTDGHVDNKYTEYVTVSSRLADDVEALAKSLGCNVTRSTKAPTYTLHGVKLEGKLAYRLFITSAVEIAKLPRKQNSSRKLLYNFITDIRQLPEPIEMRCITVSSKNSLYITNDYVVTHNSGKSVAAGVVALKELLVPYSSTILLAPSYRGADIIFSEVYKLVLKLQLPIKKLNKNQFTIELENGASFGAFSENNVEASLGSRVSLLIVDETQSFSNILHIIESLLGPMMLDYSVNDFGVLNAKTLFLGTPRGTGSQFHQLFLNENTQSNWQSFSAPSTCNPLLPKVYIEDQKNVLSERAFNQEILALWVTSGAGVLHAFSKEYNLYDPMELDLKGSDYIMGFDWGVLDSTAAVVVYVNKLGDYYVDRTYSKGSQTTVTHLAAFRELENRDTLGNCVGRYSDPSAAQSILDMRNTYNYDMQKAYNRIAPGIAILNDLLEPQGYNRVPRLFINKNCTELINEIQLITYKNEDGKQANTGDPFKRPVKGHYDNFHALRYAIVTHYRQNQAAVAILA